jgi:hypothetical protein
MSNKFHSRAWFAVAALLGMVLLLPVPQPAASQTPINPEEPACIQCHEDLYYLHDTGKWFCISKSPMQCTGCHGGDPTAITKEAAHQHRTAHPVINGDTTTCRQCHVEDCAERVSKFDAIAGISLVVLVSTPVGPAPVASTVVTPVPPTAAEAAPLWFWPLLLTIAVLAIGLALFGWRRSHPN